MAGFVVYRDASDGSAEPRVDLLNQTPRRDSRCALRESDLGKCDPAVIRRSGYTSRNAGIVFRKWSGGPGFEPGASRSRTVSVPCPPVSDRLPRRPCEYEIGQAGVL